MAKSFLKLDKIWSSYFSNISVQDSFERGKSGVQSSEIVSESLFCSGDCGAKSSTLHFSVQVLLIEFEVFLGSLFCCMLCKPEGGACL